MEALQPVQEAPLALPSAEIVLDKVKSDGTFDQFRKTCLAAVEAEVNDNTYTLTSFFTHFLTHLAVYEGVWRADRSSV